MADLEADLDIIRKFQAIAARKEKEKEEEDHKLWSPAARKEFKEARDKRTEQRERVYFGRDTAGVQPDETSFDVESNLDNIDGIGHFLERLHSMERAYPYRIPKGW